MEPILQGPGLWNFIHISSLHYPEKPTDEDKENFKMFINSLEKILPCDECKKHFQKIL